MEEGRSLEGDSKGGPRNVERELCPKVHLYPLHHKVLRRGEGVCFRIPLRKNNVRAGTNRLTKLN